jgi:hypothetical protein
LGLSTQRIYQDLVDEPHKLPPDCSHYGEAEAVTRKALAPIKTVEPRYNLCSFLSRDTQAIVLNDYRHCVPSLRRSTGTAGNQHRQARRLSARLLQLKAEGVLVENCQHRPVQYLNNVLEQDHRAIKRLVRASQHFRSFWGAWRTIAGYEAVHMIRKGQACESATGTGSGLLHRFVLAMFGIDV